MNTENSLLFFHTPPENYNCAQAILKGFQDKYAISDETIETFRAYGGGRSEGGICGALFAVNYLRSLQNLSSLTNEFQQQIGFITCKEIKQIGKVPCSECVRIADELLRKK